MTKGAIPKRSANFLAPSTSQSEPKYSMTMPNRIPINQNIYSVTCSSLIYIPKAGHLNHLGRFRRGKIR